MSSTPASVLDLREKTELRELASLVAAIRAAAPTVEPLLVGAMARDIQFGHARNLWAPRATHDMDFAFCLDGWEAFETLRLALLRNASFRQSQDVPHRMYYAGTTRLDVLPFGGMEQTDRTVLWPPQNDVRMNLVGYREASLQPTRVLLPASQEVAVVSIAGFALLKLFAWQDRKGVKDAGDLRFVAENYLEAFAPDRLYVEGLHLLDSNEFDYLAAGAWLLGHDVAQLVGLSPGSDAVQQALALLDPQLDETGPLRLVADMGGSADRNFRTLAAFRSGLTRSATPFAP